MTFTLYYPFSEAFVALGFTFTGDFEVSFNYGEPSFPCPLNAFCCYMVICNSTSHLFALLHKAYLFTSPSPSPSPPSFSLFPFRRRGREGLFFLKNSDNLNRACYKMIQVLLLSNFTWIYKKDEIKGNKLKLHMNIEKRIG